MSRTMYNTPLTPPTTCRPPPRKGQGMNLRFLSLRRTILSCAALALLAWSAGFAQPPAVKLSAKQVAFFEKEVLPILKDNCFKCHSDPKKLRGSLSLASRAGILKGGDLGPAVDLQKPDD